MIDREPPRRDGAVRYIYWDLRFAHSLRDYISASEYIYAFEKKPNEHSFSSWSIEYYTARMNIDLSDVLTLFFYHRKRDVYSFHYFQISALKATLWVSNPLISVPLSSSLCMRLHFLLGWNVPNRSFFLPVSPLALIWQLVGTVRLYSESTAIRFESIVQKSVISEKRECGLKEVHRNWKDR